MSPIYTNTPQVLPNMGTLLPEKFPEHVFPNGWFIFDPQGTNSSTCVNQLTGGGASNILFNAIAKGELNEEIGFVWSAETYLYEKIKRGELNTGDPSLFSTFQEENNNTNLEEFHNISEELATAFENPTLSNDLESYISQKSLIESEIESLENQIINNGITEGRKIMKENLLNEVTEINLVIENVYSDYKLDLQSQMLQILRDNEQINPLEIFETNKKKINQIVISAILNGTDNY